MRKAELLALGTALFLAAAGSAHAQGASAPGAAPQPGGVSGQDVSGPGGPLAIGRTVYDRSGEAIAQVKAVEGDRVILSIARGPGMGGREVVIAAAELDPGSGADQRLTTALSPAELQRLPEAAADPARASSPPPR